MATCGTQLFGRVSVEALIPGAEEVIPNGIRIRVSTLRVSEGPISPPGAMAESGD